VSVITITEEDFHSQRIFFNFNDLVDAVADLKRGKNDGFAGLSSDRSFHYWL